MAVTREKVVALGAAVVVATVVPGTLGYATERISAAEQARAEYAEVQAASGRPFSEPCHIERRTVPPVQAGGRGRPGPAPRTYPRNRARDRSWTHETEREERSPARPLNVRKTRRPRIPEPEHRPLDPAPLPTAPSLMPKPTGFGASRLPLAPTGRVYSPPRSP